MAVGPTARPPVPPAHRRWGRRSRWFTALLVVVLVAVGTYGVAEYAAHLPPSGPTLTIWTYSSFFGSGSDPGAARGAVFDQFENLTGAHVQVVYQSSDLASTLLTTPAAQRPDLVVGLDEITSGEVERANLLLPYSPPNLASVPPALVRALGPGGGVVPYEYGYLGVDYNRSEDNASGHPYSQGSFFSALPAEPSLASQFVYEDPAAGSIVGEEFLAWEYEYYTQVLHQNWTGFWKGIAPHAIASPDWTDAYNEFSAGQAAACVSYVTDPAYNYYFGYGGGTGSAVAVHNGTSYGWETIYGAGILNSSKHVALAEEFVNWLLGGTVQSLVATNEWEYPANSTVLSELPPAYQVTLPPSSITPLNPYLPPVQAAEELPQWILELQSLGV